MTLEAVRETVSEGTQPEEQMILELVLPKRHPLFSLFNVKKLRTEHDLNFDYYVTFEGSGRAKNVGTAGSGPLDREAEWKIEVLSCKITSASAPDR